MEKKLYEPCIFCLKPIEPDNIDNVFGKVGNILCDYLFFNSFSQTIKKEFEKYSKNTDDLVKIICQMNKREGYNIYSCNHFIHYSCFLKLNQNNLKCPLCKQKLNLFIPSLTQTINKDSFIIFQGLNLIGKDNKSFLLSDNNRFSLSISEEEKMKMKEFDKSKIDILCEVSKRFIYSFNLNSHSENCDIVKQLIMKISLVLSDFFDFIDNFEDIHKKFDNYKNLLLAIRLLLKMGNNETTFNYLIELLNQLLYFSNEDKFCKMIFENDLKIVLSQILTIIAILFDYETIKGYEKYIIKLFLPLYIIQYYIRSILINNELQFDLNVLKSKYNYSLFKEYLKTDNNVENTIKFIARNIKLTNQLIRSNNNFEIDFNNLLNEIGFSDIKLNDFIDTIYLPDYLDEKNPNNINSTMHSFFGQFLPKMKINDFFDEKYFVVFENYINKKNNILFINPKLLGSCLPISYSFINLPKLAIDLQYSFFEVPCSYCKKIGCPSFICLTCRAKICNLTYNQCKGSLYLHNQECGKQRSIFISTYNYKIVLMSFSDKIEKDIPLYVNKFGESIDNNNVTSNDIRLNEEEIKVALKTFINYSLINN